MYDSEKMLKNHCLYFDYSDWHYYYYYCSDCKSRSSERSWHAWSDWTGTEMHMGIACIWTWAEVAFPLVYGWLKLCSSCSPWEWPWPPPRPGPQTYLHWTPGERCWYECACLAIGWTESHNVDTNRASSRGTPGDCCSETLTLSRSNSMDSARSQSCSGSGCSRV